MQLGFIKQVLSGFSEALLQQGAQRSCAEKLIQSFR